MIEQLVNQAIFQNLMPKIYKQSDVMTTADLRGFILMRLEDCGRTDEEVEAYRELLEKASTPKTSIQVLNKKIRIDQACFYYRLGYNSDEIRQAMEAQKLRTVKATESERIIAKVELEYGLDHPNLQAIKNRILIKYYRG